jgi:glycosyltransferase involved in cell wall biosynthesis
MSRKILVRGPALSRSGYGEHCRSVLRALRSDDRNDVYLLNVGWGASGWLFEENEERDWIDSTIMKTAKKVQSGELDFDLSIQVQLPTEWQPLCEKNIGITAGVETTQAPAAWVEACEQMDHIIVPSQHSKDCFTEALSEKIDVVNFPARHTRSEKIDFSVSSEFNFLTVAQWNPRKNVEQTIFSFVQEFQNEDVGLVLKLGIQGGTEVDREHVKTRLEGLLAELPQDRKCKVHLLHGTLSDGQMVSLYKNKNISAYITTSHGEGYGLPVFEAAQHGVPVLAPNWGGIKEFSNNSIVEINYEERNLEKHHSWEGVLEETSSWCFPDTNSVRSQMREVYNNLSKYKKQAKSLQNHIKDNFTEQQVNLCYNNVIDSVLQTTTEGDNTNEVKRPSISSNHDGSTKEPTGAD